MSKQVRFIPTQNCGLQIREPQEGQTASRRIAGRPIVFGVRSNNLTPWSDYREVYEVLEPGCISAEVMQKSDIVLNTNHRNDVSCILGRYRNSDKDTLKLELRADGVDCDCDLPNTTTADDTLELIKRGDIDGMSFAFEDDYEDSENGVSYERMRDEETGKKEIWVRHVKRITALYDVSVVTHPAYEQTTVGVREQGDRINEAIEAQLKREQNTDDDPDKKGDGEGEETDEEREAREKAEREANGGETNAEKQAREEREALEAKEQREREAVAVMRMRRNRLSLMNREIEDIIY
jgi:HK97 family phage prohead protease